MTRRVPRSHPGGRWRAKVLVIVAAAVPAAALGACGGGSGSTHAVSPACDQAMSQVDALPGLNATAAQTPEVVISARTQTLLACRSSSEWKAAVDRHPGVLPPRTSPGDGLKSFCRAAASDPARLGATCKG